MKLLLLFVLPFFVLSTFAQIRDLSECSQVTVQFISKFYDFDKQLEIKESPEKLSKLDYICAHSYEYADDFVLESQKSLFVVQRYEHMRAEGFRVKIYDEYSGLNIVLYSWTEVNAEKQKINARFQLVESKEPTGKKKRKQNF